MVFGEHEDAGVLALQVENRPPEDPPQYGFRPCPLLQERMVAASTSDFSEQVGLEFWGRKSRRWLHLLRHRGRIRVFLGDSGHRSSPVLTQPSGNHCRPRRCRSRSAYSASFRGALSSSACGPQPSRSGQSQTRPWWRAPDPCYWISNCHNSTEITCGHSIPAPCRRFTSGEETHTDAAQTESKRIAGVATGCQKHRPCGVLPPSRPGAVPLAGRNRVNSRRGPIGWSAWLPHVVEHGGAEGDVLACEDLPVPRGNGRDVKATDLEADEFEIWGNGRRVEVQTRCNLRTRGFRCCNRQSHPTRHWPARKATNRQ